MADTLKLRGGTTTQNAAFTGADREVTVDTTKKTLVVHDGANAGGTPLMREEGNSGSQTPSVKFATSGTDAIVIDSSQNVGIARGTPNAKLDVNGSAIFNGNIGIGITQPTFASGGGLHVRGATGGQTRFHLTTSHSGDTAADGFYIIGLGAESGGSSGEVSIMNMESKRLRIGTAGSDAIVIDSSQNVGIGATNPSGAKLHIVGSGNTGLKVQVGSSSADEIYLGNTGGASSVGTLTNVGFNLIQNGGVALAVNTNKNVGIGVTSNLAAKLVVARDVASSAEHNFNNQTAILMNSGSGSIDGRTSLYFASYNSSNQLSPAAISCTANTNYQSSLHFFTNQAGNGTGHLEASERMLIDSSGNVGIGTTSPDTRLTVARPTSGNVIKGLSTNNNTRSRIDLTGKDPNGALVTLIMGGDGDFGGMVFTHSNHRLGFSTNNAAPQMVLDTSGKVGIGTTSPSEKLNVSGNILATGTITPNSDIAFKKDIEPLTNVLNKVTQLLGINFTYKNNNEKSMGLVAQDVEKVFPELVRGEEGNKSLNYMGLTGALIEAIKELSAKVEALEVA